jgi:hypothetical protein
VPRNRLILQPASQITETHDWWPLAEGLAQRVGEPLLASGVSRPARPSRVTAPRQKPGQPVAEDQLALDLGH